MYIFSSFSSDQLVLKALEKNFSNASNSNESNIKGFKGNLEKKDFKEIIKQSKQLYDFISLVKETKHSFVKLTNYTFKHDIPAILAILCFFEQHGNNKAIKNINTVNKAIYYFTNNNYLKKISFIINLYMGIKNIFKSNDILKNKIFKFLKKYMKNEDKYWYDAIEENDFYNNIINELMEIVFDDIFILKEPLVFSNHIDSVILFLKYIFYMKKFKIYLGSFIEQYGLINSYNLINNNNNNIKFIKKIIKFFKESKKAIRRIRELINFKNNSIKKKNEENLEKFFLKSIVKFNQKPKL